MRALYISYDGMLEPLGQSQVMAYQQKLAKSNVVHILSFEKAPDWANEFELKGTNKCVCFMISCSLPL